jgi:hypothetical protein
MCMKYNDLTKSLGISKERQWKNQYVGYTDYIKTRHQVAVSRVARFSLVLLVNCSGRGHSLVITVPAI